MKRYVIALACAFACYMVLQVWVETVSHQVAQSRAGTHADRTSQGRAIAGNARRQRDRVQCHKLERARDGRACLKCQLAGDTTAPIPLFAQQLQANSGTVITATDYVCALPQSVPAFLPADRSYLTLGPTALAAPIRGRSCAANWGHSACRHNHRAAYGHLR